MGIPLITQPDWSKFGEVETLPLEGRPAPLPPPPNPEVFNNEIQFIFRPRS